MTETGGGWASPSGDGDWQPPSYDPSYPQPAAPSPPSYGPPSVPPPTQAYQGWGPTWSPKPGVVPLRPLGVGELLDGGVKLIRTYPKPTLALSAVVTLVVTLFDIAAILLADQSTTISADGSSDTAFGRDFNLASIPSYALEIFGSAVLTGVLVTVVSRAVLGQGFTAAEALAVAKQRFWALLGVALLRLVVLAVPVLLVVGAALVAGPVALLLLLAVIPLEVWLWTVTAVSPAALVLEKTSPWKALQRSRVLAGRAFWRTFGLLALAWVITRILASILLIPVVLVFELPLFQGHEITLGTTFAITTALVSAVLQTFLSPYTSGLFGLVYIDQRMRSEGLDVALQAAASAPATTSA